jgi:hypothetical protein
MANSLSVIADEISILRELYEMELAARQPPIWRVTESPGPSDTEVLYSSDPPPKRQPFDSEEDEEFFQ